MKKYILSLDLGTSSLRALIFDEGAKIIATAQKEFSLFFPHEKFVEQNPIEILEKQIEVIKLAVSEANISYSQIAGIGITNQRETTVIWNKHTGKPIYNAIVWQDKRTENICKSVAVTQLKSQIQQKTGLVVDAYFSATKIKWLLDNISEARQLAENSDLLFGTIDSWIIWNLSGGKAHVTDYSNASRTMLFNINTLDWDAELLDLFNVPKNILPKVLPSDSNFGVTDEKLFGIKIPIMSVMGDQQSALFGQLCFDSGDAKCTYGTGCFLLMNIGSTPKISKNNLLTTIAWGLNGKVSYAIEAAIFDAGSVINWLKNNLQIAKTAKEIDVLASSVEDSGDTVFIPAFSGLGAPHWNMNAKASITGITHSTNKAHIARAALEGIALQVNDVFELLESDSGNNIKNFNVDGGLTKSKILMQIQADILQKNINVQTNPEMTACGVAYMAGIKLGFWNEADLKKFNKAKIIASHNDAEENSNLKHDSKS
jgi:glycerol kinase